jgi:hypothetical protein
MQGIIGIPVALPHFLTMPDYRSCFLHTQAALQTREFITHCLFFQEAENAPDLVITRLAKARVDSVLWFLPGGADRETAARVRDRGIHFIGVNLGGAAGIPCRYEVRRWDAIRTILRAWRADPKINVATLIQERTGSGLRAGGVRLQKLAAEEEIDCRVVSAPPGNVSKFLKSLCADEGSGILLPAPVAALLASHAPDELADLLQACRVALLGGPMDLPNLVEAEVDVVTTRWTRIAARIVDDLLSGEALTKTESTAFEASAHLRVPLGRLAADL